MTIENLSVHQLGKLSPQQLVKASGYQFMHAQQNLKEKLEQLQDAKSHLDGGMKLKYSDKIAEAREQEDKPYGVIHIEDDEVDIAVDAKKTVSWDQKELAKLYKKRKILDYHTEELIEVTYKINEAKYKQLSEAMKKIVGKARSARVSSTPYTLKLKK
jgi:hypothetical protein